MLLAELREGEKISKNDLRHGSRKEGKGGGQIRPRWEKITRGTYY